VDPLQRARLWDTIRASAEGGAGVLVSTHHMSEAEQCDRLLVLAGGRVAAEGTMEQVIGGTRAVEVRAGRWEEAFTALDAAGLPVSLVGTALRVPGADPETVGRPLAGAGVDAHLDIVPASFEEAFVVLAGRRAA
jgi:ABC-type multidrug transport system ATPase subunit